mgnify:CR=1 FL=1
MNVFFIPSVNDHLHLSLFREMLVLSLPRVIWRKSVKRLRSTRYDTITWASLFNDVLPFVYEMLIIYVISGIVLNFFLACHVAEFVSLYSSNQFVLSLSINHISSFPYHVLCSWSLFLCQDAWVLITYLVKCLGWSSC